MIEFVPLLFPVIAWITFMVISDIYNHNFYPLVWTASFLFILWYIFDLPIIKIISQYMYTLIPLIPVYFALGVIWSLSRWSWFLADKKLEYLACKFNLLNKYNEMTEEYKELIPFTNFVLENHAEEYNRCSIIPNPNEYRDIIIHWAAYWPLNAIVFLFKNFIDIIFGCSFSFIKSMYVKETKDVFEDFDFLKY